jgi:hypothetical protein
VGTAPAAFTTLLDVAVEFRYDIRLCQFALDQLSFAFTLRAACTVSSYPAGPFSKRAKV